MTWFFMALALAATPEELEAAAGSAAEQLERCADEGCGPEDGARAAFLVALHTYQSEGFADGELAATVRYLAPPLFADLPDVLQDAASRPLPWATRTLSVRERMPAALFEGPEPGPYTAPEKTNLHTTLTVEVLARSGEPIPSAVVRFFADYHERHRVNTKVAKWTGSVLYGKDEERVFHKGMGVDLQVTAPGFEPYRAHVVLRKKKNEVTIVLDPFTPTSDGSEAAEAALEAYGVWMELDERAREQPSEGTYDVEDLARLEGAVAARAWMDEGGGDDARTLCLMMGSIPYCSVE